MPGSGEKEKSEKTRVLFDPESKDSHMPNLIPIRAWATKKAPKGHKYPHREALRLVKGGRIPGAKRYGTEAHNMPPRGAKGGWRGFWMVPAGAKWPEIRGYAKNGKKRQSKKVDKTP
jgi:hypothetical protein